MTGDHAFNEVFLDEVRLPADHLIGVEHDGWRLAKVTLGNERVSLSGEGALWGRGPTAHDLIAAVRDTGNLDALRRDALVRCWSHGEILRLLRERLISAALAGREPGAEASVRKALADDHGQEVMGLAKDLAGTAGMIAGRGPGGVAGEAGALWSHGFLYSQALTIGCDGTVAGERLSAIHQLAFAFEDVLGSGSGTQLWKGWSSQRNYEERVLPSASHRRKDLAGRRGF